MWGIGVDNDQAFLGTAVLTSATKKVDVGVFADDQARRTTGSSRAASTASST